MVLGVTILPQKPTATVVSNVVIANDAFKHVVTCFDTLQTIMGQCGLLSSDFAVDVGFVDECHERTQGVYLYCRNRLDDEIQASLLELFHPFPYTILPIPDLSLSSVGDHDSDYSSLPQDTGHGQDKGKQKVGKSSLGNYGGNQNSEGNAGREGEDQGDSGEDTGSNGNDGCGGSGIQLRCEPSEGQGGHRKLCGDFESKAYCSLTEPQKREIQSFTIRANIEITVILLLI